MSHPSQKGKSGEWQYHPRSDHHSKVICWGILFDLLLESPLLQEHVRARKLAFGLNHEMRDFRTRRKKNLDLVLATPGSGSEKNPLSFVDLVEKYEILLDSSEERALSRLPRLERKSVGSVSIALEAKACMTEHLKARPRLYDELNSSHDVIHGTADVAIAAGFAMVNLADEFISPLLNRTWKRPSKITPHDQPRVAKLVIEKIHEIPRRSSTGKPGFDAFGISVVNCRNDGTPVSIVQTPPAPQPLDPVHYESMIARIKQLYHSRFPQL